MILEYEGFHEHDQKFINQFLSDQNDPPLLTSLGSFMLVLNTAQWSPESQVEITASDFSSEFSEISLNFSWSGDCKDMPFTISLFISFPLPVVSQLNIIWLLITL